jgi:hypothetical protein
MANQSNHLFICYSSQDRSYAHLLAELLKIKGFDVWIDNQRLKCGENWEEVIKEAIEECAGLTECVKHLRQLATNNY